MRRKMNNERKRRNVDKPSKQRASSSRLFKHYILSLHVSAAAAACSLTRYSFLQSFSRCTKIFHLDIHSLYHAHSSVLSSSDASVLASQHAM